MAGTLESFFVSLGIKGQDVVLKNIDKIKKEATGLSKIKANIDMGKGNISKAISSMASGGKSISKVMGITGQAPSQSQPQTPEQKKEDDANKKFVKSVNGFAAGVKNFATTSANLDPTAVIQGQVKAVGDALGDALSGISVAGFSLGNVPKAIAEMGNAMFGMATGAIDMAKQSAATQWGLTERNSTVSHYGGGNVNSGAADAGISRNEYATLMMKVAGSNGRLDTSLKGMISELAKTKDTEQLGNVASGNFASTGTTKGWMMQQVMDSLGNVPPEIRQAMTKSLLPQISGDIMGREEQGGMSGSQAENAKWQAKTENQATSMYNLSAGNTGVESLQDSLNAFQRTLFNTGVGAADAIDNMAKSIASMPDKIKKAGEALEWMSNKIYTLSLHSIDIRNNK
jgi:hypothetical protein